MTLQRDAEADDAQDGTRGGQEPVDAAGSAVAGKSPTQIAFQRLRADKVAVVCTVILLVLVALAALGPVIVRVFNIYPTISFPGAPRPSEMLDQFGFPETGPPVLRRGPRAPARHRAALGLRQPGQHPLRPQDVADRGHRRRPC